MCLAVPMEVKEIKTENNSALVSAGGTEREVRLDLVDEMPEIGDYVLVHAGYALHRIDEQTAKETLELLEEIFGNEIS
ncbi:MAG: HypC/HybG/HupF family hydrogenase formation chaperone [bacterium]